MVSPPSCHQSHEKLLQTRDVGGVADWRPFQLSTITSLHSQRRNEFAGAPEGSGRGVEVSGRKGRRGEAEAVLTSPDLSGQVKVT